MRMILAPEERLFAVGARQAGAALVNPKRRAADRLPGTMTGGRQSAAHGPFRTVGGYAARQLQRALAEYQARSETA